MTEVKEIFAPEAVHKTVALTTIQMKDSICEVITDALEKKDFGKNKPATVYTAQEATINIIKDFGKRDNFLKHFADTGLDKNTSVQIIDILVNNVAEMHELLCETHAGVTGERPSPRERNILLQQVHDAFIHNEDILEFFTQDKSRGRKNF
jgi:hypothetical protein